MRYVIAYDIINDSRRNRVAKFLEGWGRRVQKSLFECELSHKELEEVSTSLKGLLNPDDRCHIYRLCLECFSERMTIGNDIEPEWDRVVVAHG